MAKEEVKAVKSGESSVLNLNNTFKKLITTISGNGGGDVTSRMDELNAINQDVERIIAKDLQPLDDWSGGELSTFLVKTMNQQENDDNATIQTVQDIFEKDSGNVLSFFQSRYKNMFLMYDDLKTIEENLYELQEAVKTTRDAIVTSDDLSHLISRTLAFKNDSEGERVNTSYITMIEAMEDEFKLPQKLKNHIIPNTLRFGTYYVYTVPYSEIFKQHVLRKNKTKSSNGVSLESYTDVSLNESINKPLGEQSKVTTKDVSAFNAVLENFSIIPDEDIPIPLIEGGELDGLIGAKFEKAQRQMRKNGEARNLKVAQDGTVDKDTDFSSVNDCYVQMIDPRKLIPVKIMNEVIGYYYIHEEETIKKKSPFTTTLNLQGNSNVSSEDAERVFMKSLTDKIVKSFDKSYLETNAKFKDLILNSLLYHDVYGKKLKYQFIPEEYITEFSVNKDEEGNGKSILYASLFYAKLYLAILIFKIISIINKSNDTRINYVKTGIDKNIANKVQDVARTMKQRHVNFNDLLNYNTMVSKAGASREIYMPVGASGERGIEFDILSGQDVPLNTELMEMLRTGAINATSVPSVIMNYVNEADYAKTLVMANSKFLTTIIGLQMDFNPQITELYKKIMTYSQHNFESNAINQFTYKLSPPRSLNSMNMADLINNAEQTIAFVLKTITGENSDQSEMDNRVKDEMFLAIAEEMLPMLPWAKMKKMLTDAKVSAAQKEIEDKAKEDGDAQ